MKAKELEREINDQLFLMKGGRFIRDKKISFETNKQAEDFLIKFLLVECVAGTHYKKYKLVLAYLKVRHLVSSKKVISSEKLPLIRLKKHSDKVLQNVEYSLQGNICAYKKNSP